MSVGQQSPYPSEVVNWAISAILSLTDLAPGNSTDRMSAWKAFVAAELRAAASILYDISGNSFRPPPPIDPTWLTGTIRLLAEAAYQERLLPTGELDPGRLAVLADALEEVGADATLLEHLRAPGVHVRGCHVVDLLTGRE
jgi:hypothetical protein